MTQDKRPDGNSPLPLPTPRSGAGLDRKIIDYARAKAPSPRPRYAPRWYAGMATAAVVVAAVLVTLPPQVPAPATQEARQQPAPAEAPPGQAAMKTSRIHTLEMLANPAPAARSATGLADDADAPRAADSIQEAAAPRTARDRDSAGAFAGKVLPPGKPPGPGALAQQLERYRALLRSGAQDEARAEYRQLRLDCPDCELPETLEQALSLYPARE